MASSVRSGEKESFWREAIARQAARGLSVRAFCRQQDLHESQFYAWRCEIALRDREASEKAGGSAPQFLPVYVTDGEGSHFDCPIEVVSPGGWRLRMARGACVSQAADLLRQFQQLGQSGDPHR
jgi:hypothetical protein